MIKSQKVIMRRTFLKYATGVALFLGPLASLGMFFKAVVSFLYPKANLPQWAFVTTVGDLPVNRSMEYITPEGQSVIISRLKSSGQVSDFLALSNICPHLGCKVYWQKGDQTFFCPCHNGKFNAEGKPLAGPPARDNQELIKFPLKIEKGLLYIRIPSESLTRLSQLKSQHDGCKEDKEETRWS